MAYVAEKITSHVRLFLMAVLAACGTGHAAVGGDASYAPIPELPQIREPQRGECTLPKQRPHRTSTKTERQQACTGYQRPGIPEDAELNSADAAIRVEDGSGEGHTTAQEYFLTAVMLWSGSAEEAERWLQDPAVDINARVKKVTALQTAVQWGSAQACSWLLERGADAHVRNDYGDTILHYAAGRNWVDVVRVILASRYFCLNNAVNKEGQTALHQAAKAGHDEVVRALVEDPFTDLDAIDAQGCTAFDRAVEKEKHSIAELLLGEKNFTRINTPVDERGITALHRLAAERMGSKAANLLLDRKEYQGINAVTRLAMTTLHTAITGRNQQLALRICKDPRLTSTTLNIVSTSGNTVLHLAVHGGLKQVRDAIWADPRFTRRSATDSLGYFVCPPQDRTIAEADEKSDSEEDDDDMAIW